MHAPQALLMLLWFIFISVALTASTGRQCFTPGKRAQEGRCVDLRNCTDLNIQLRAFRARPRTKEIDLYMRNIRAACSDVAGHSEGQEICCTYLGPKPTMRKPKKNTTPRPPLPRPRPPPPPPAVLPGHRCLSLLPSTQLCEQIISGLVFHANVSRRGEHPWMALLSRMRKANGEPVFDCTGSLISHRHVLTVAHCISGGLPILVRLGEYDLRQDPDCGGETTCSSYKDVGVQEMIPHEQYWSPTWESGRLRHDIALITLAEDVVFNAFIKPICLPPPKVAAMSLENRQFKIAGWGDTIASNGSKGTPSPVLLEGTVTVMSDDTCAARHQNFSGSKHTDSWPDVRTQVCALGKDGVDSCRGDSGGPLVYLSRESNVIVGLVSAGSSLCGVNNSALPGVYTRVAPYIEWILDHMCTPQ